MCHMSRARVRSQATWKRVALLLMPEIYRHTVSGVKPWYTRPTPKASWCTSVLLPPSLCVTRSTSLPTTQNCNPRGGSGSGLGSRVLTPASSITLSHCSLVCTQLWMLGSLCAASHFQTAQPPFPDGCGGRSDMSILRTFLNLPAKLLFLPFRITSRCRRAS